MLGKINKFSEFKKCLFIVLILAIFIAAPNLAHAQSAATQKAASKSWTAFWVKFTKAVKTKNRQAFIALTSKDYKDGGGGTVEEYIDNTPWNEIRKSVDRGTRKYSFNDGQVWRVTRDKGLLFVYEKGGWKFFGELIA